MSVVAAVLAVGAGSLLFRLLPLLGANRLPDRVTRVAGWAGLSVLAAITVRSVVTFEDPAMPGGAPLVAAVAVGAGLYLAFRGRSLLLAAATGAGCYLVLSAALAAVS